MLTIPQSKPLSVPSSQETNVQHSHQRKMAIDRTDSEISCIEKLTDAKYQELIGGKRSGELKQMLASLRILRDKLDQSLFEVSIVGLEKSGKSTFANAYMGADILPTRDARCTYTATSICYGAENSAEVSFYSEEEFNEEFFAKLKPLALNAEEYPLRWTEWNKTMLHQAFTNSSVKNMENLLRDIEEILDNHSSISMLLGQGFKSISSERLDTEIKDYIENPSKALAVKKITIRSNQLPRNAIIYDVPGFDSPTELHKAQTREWMRKSDAVILIVNADKPSFNDSLVSFFKTIDKDQDGIDIGEKIFVFANRADQASTLEENLRQIASELCRYRIIPESMVRKRIIAGSAKAHLNIDGSGNAMQELLLQKGLSGDGIEEIRSVLNSYNDNERIEVMHRRLKNVRTRLQEVLTEIQSENQVSDDNTLEEEYQKRSNRLYLEARENVTQQIAAYQEQVNEEYQENRPITEKMRDIVAKKIDPERFQITESELREAMRQATSRANSVLPAEYSIREEKYSDMYNAFIEDVIHLATEEYDEIRKKMIAAFEKGCGISPSYSYFDKLEEGIENYVTAQCRSFSPEGYYNSLIRRYSGNLFYVLIRQPFAVESRFSSFDEWRRNFYSLAMFGRDEVLNIRPDKQPMHAKILYHQIPISEVQNMDITAVSNLVLLAEERIHQVIPAKSVLYTLLMQLAEKRGADAEDILKTLLTRLRSKDIREDGLPLFSVIPNPLEEELIVLLRAQLNESNEGTSDSLTDIGYYRDYFNSYKLENNKDVSPTQQQFPKIAGIIAREFREDVEILRDILNVEVMKAIDIEVPFLDLVEQNFRSLKESLSAEIFMDFIDENKKYILSEEYQRMKAENEVRKKRAEILHEIETIMNYTEGEDM